MQTDGPFAQVGTDAVAALIPLGRRLYLASIGAEPPLSDDEDRAFRAALAAADAETWAYPAT
jgi:hypothetical protein